MTRHRFVFVIEQGLGHKVHGSNLESVLASQTDIDATVLKVRPGETLPVRPLPFTQNWSVQTSWATRRLLRRRLSRSPVDAVFIHTQVAALFAKATMRRTPTVISLDATPLDFDTMADAYGHVRHTRSLEAAKLRINRRALSRAAAVVTWSAWTGRSVVRDYRVAGSLVYPIYPGVDLKGFEVTTRSGRPGPVRILFVGGDFARKGGEDLVAAVGELRGTAELDVVTSTADISVPVDTNVRVHRNVLPNSDELRRLYAEADIFALPTRGDCTPLVIAEAMASGLPIVATTVGSIPDMVRDGRNGILVPPSAPQQLARALETLVTDEASRVQMGLVNRDLAVKEHDATKNWQRIFAIMREVSASQGSDRLHEALVE
jgi:glycosyltransferase involved in cell wall biosynthesis